jgi:methyltransferase (TIGR00027 family)
MKNYRFDPEHNAPLLELAWEEDSEYRMSPDILTQLAREQVPVLEYVQWKVTKAEPGKAESIVPLNPQSTNQHFTHQAALLLLAADYTGGIAVASLLSGWPVVGIHPISSQRSMSLWLIKGDIKYLRPSVTDLTVTAEIEPERINRIRKRFWDGKAVLETVKIRFLNKDVLVAEAELTYFARQSEKLRSDGESPEKVNVLYQLKLTSSAELIAGVRARESGKLFHDPYAAGMAGRHGMALASRFCEKTPQLGGMVAARTRHLDAEMGKFIARGGRNIVIVGVGWDMRTFRLGLPPGTCVYELDFPNTLLERSRRIEQLGIALPPGVKRLEFPIDVRSATVASVLQNHLPFDAPVFVSMEGMSMYFEEPMIDDILKGLTPLMLHADSRFWVDLVDKQVVLNPDGFGDEVQSFMRGMQILGEPFIFGVDRVETFMDEHGFRCRGVDASDLYFEEKNRSLYSLYKFCVASRKSVLSESEPASLPPMHSDVASYIEKTHP